MKTWQNKLFLIFVEAFEWSGMICKASVRGGLYFWCRMNGWTLLTNICIPGSLCGPEKKTPLLDTSLKLIQSKKFLFRCFLQYDRLYVENEIYLYNEIEQRVERMIIGKKEVEVEFLNLDRFKTSFCRWMEPLVGGQADWSSEELRVDRNRIFFQKISILLTRPSSW